MPSELLRPALRGRGVAWLLGLALAGTPAGAGCVELSPREPRTLVLALDGVPFRAVQKARAQGAFAGWPETRPLVTPFPSMTNVGFTAILQPFGASPIAGYEVRHWDPHANRIRGGGPTGRKEHRDKLVGFEWRSHFQVAPEGNLAKAGIYFIPKRYALTELDQVEALVLEHPSELMLALVSATDSLTHFHGDDAIVSVVRRIAERVDALARAHEQRYGRPLRVVMLSDHGNVEQKVRTPGLTRDLLREAGLQPVRSLEGERDVVGVTYGVVGYGALYLDPKLAETAARAVLGHPGVHVAAWTSAEDEVRLVSRAGEARIRWRERLGQLELAYDVDRGEPFGYAAIRAGMRDQGLFDDEGFASAEDWFEWTALSEYPDALRRLVNSLTGTWVATPATVIFSFYPGWAWGAQAAQAGAWLLGGKLEATHGALDRESTLGFFLRSDGEAPPELVLHAERVLAEFADLAPCMDASLFDGGACAHSTLHAARTLE